MKLDDQQSAFIKLLLRSPDIGEGWRKVSNILIRATEIQVALNPELFEFESMPEGSRIRLTERGSVLGEYL